MVMGIKALSLELLLCLELTGPEATIDRGLSTDGEHEEEADARLMCGFAKAWFCGF